MVVSSVEGEVYRARKVSLGRDARKDSIILFDVSANKPFVLYRQRVTLRLPIPILHHPVRSTAQTHSDYHPAHPSIPILAFHY
jgi:hypothetical protein